MLGDVSDVEPVRVGCGELAVDEIVAGDGRFVAAGAAMQPAAVDAFQASAFHQPLDPAWADGPVAAQHQFGVDPPVAVGAIRRLVGVVDLVHQIRLLEIPRAWHATVPLIET